MGRKPGSLRERAEALGIPPETLRYREGRGFGRMPRAEYEARLRDALRSVKGGEAPEDRVRAGEGLTRELERCLAVYDRRKAAGEALTYEAIRQEAGTSSMPVRRALDIRHTEERVAEEKQWQLTASQKERLEAALRAHRKALEREIDQRVHELAHEMIDKTLLARLEEREKRVRHFDAAWRGIFNRAEYQLLLKCLHPDSNCDPEQYNEAFRLVRQREDVLLKKEARRPVGAEAMPKTLAEMMARRRS